MKAMISTDMKQMNRKIVFDIVRKLRSVTRVELSELTGMSGPSIMAIVNEFVEKGILTESGKIGGSVGRSPVTMTFNPDVMMSIGIEFEGNHLSIGLVNLDGEIRFQTMAKVPSNLGDSFYQTLYKSIDKMEQKIAQEGLTYCGIGMGIPGALNPQEKIIYFAPYIGVMEPVDISAQIGELEKKYQKPVFVENDVNMSAVGEFYYRRTKEDISDLLYISIGAGIGAGIILNGELRHGRRNLCGEIGYSLRDSQGKVSRKETGWLERHLSEELLCERFPEYGMNGTVSSEMAEHVADLICPFIANLLNALDIDKVVIGGQLLVNGGDELLKVIRDRTKRLALSEAEVHGCRTEYTGVAGSALLASDRLWNTIL